MVWVLPPGLSVLYFMVITFIAHTVIDYFTSRLNSKLWARAEYWRKRTETDSPGYPELQGRFVHRFFVSIGFDQLLHFIQLLLTYWILR